MGYDLKKAIIGAIGCAVCVSPITDSRFYNLWNVFAEESGREKIFDDVDTYIDSCSLSVKEVANLIYRSDIFDWHRIVKVTKHGILETVYKLPDEEAFIKWLFDKGRYKAVFRVSYSDKFTAEGDTLESALCNLRTLLAKTYEEGEVENSMRKITISVRKIELIY